MIMIMNKFPLTFVMPKIFAVKFRIQRLYIKYKFV